MSLLDAIKGVNLRHSHIERDGSAPVLKGKLVSISKEYDSSVLDCNLEHWAPLLGNLTYDTLLVPISPIDARRLLECYEDTERHPDVVEAAAASYVPVNAPYLDLPPLNDQETALRLSLGTSIQTAIDTLSTSQCPVRRGCFVKLSSRSPKDAAARSGVFETFYSAAIARSPEALSDPNVKLKILCEAESAALKFSNSMAVIRALILSERVWQDMTLALRHPENWQQNIIIRRWEFGEIDMEFRMFVFQNKLTAISQYAYQLHSPRLLDLRSQLLNHLCDLYDNQLRPKLSTSIFKTCVIDVVILSIDGKFQSKVIEINPFLPTTDGGLFSWETEQDLLEGTRAEVGYPILRLNEKARVGAIVMVPKGWRDIVERVDRKIREQVSASSSVPLVSLVNP